VNLDGDVPIYKFENMCMLQLRMQVNVDGIERQKGHILYSTGRLLYQNDMF
jgi:hypothetical protein